MSTDTEEKTTLAEMLAGAEPDTGETADAEAAETSSAPVIPAPEDLKATKKMTVAKLDAFYESGQLSDPIAGWDDMNKADKVAAIAEALGFSEEAPEEAPASEQTEPDQLMTISQEIEGLDDQKTLEARIQELLEGEGLSDFRLGGLFARLQDIGDFGDAANFAEYVFARFGIKYRKARYLIEIYTGLLNAGVAWEKVKEVGWTKLKTIVSILTPDNVDEWVAKALAMNTISLEQAVKDYKAAQAGDEGSGSEPSSDMKTKTFKLAPDQLETVDDAIQKAKDQSGTDSPSAALEFMSMDFLGSAKEPVAPLKNKIKELEAQLKSGGGGGDTSELEAQIEELNGKLNEMVKQNGQLETDLKAAKKAAETAGANPKPAVMYETIRAMCGDDLQMAMNTLFGDDSGFEKAFPEIALKIGKK